MVYAFFVSRQNILMMKRLNFFVLTAMILCFPQSGIAQWQTDRTKYYDFDGDKQLEWDKDLWIYKHSQSDGSIVKVVEKPHRLAVWTNVNNDGYIDWHRLSGTNHLFYCGTEEESFREISVHTENKKLPFDYNNDGYPDWIDSGSRKDAFTENGNNALNTSIRIYTPDEYAGNANPYRGGLVVQQLGNALSYDMFLGTSSVSATLAEYCIDMNGDGISDYIDCQTGKYIQNRLNGEGIIYTLGKVQIEDLNGDGIMDMISCGSQSVVAHFMQRDGSVESKTVYSGATLNKPVWCYDFDKDGDIDLLLPYGYMSSVNGSYLVLLENKGNGKFNSQEVLFTKNLRFEECIDFDSDGNIEVVGYENTGEYPVCFVRIKDGKICEEIEYISGIYATQNKPLLIADIENNGFGSLIMDNNTITKLSTVANERPSQPQKPTMIYEASTGLLKINWQPTVDKESSSADLTYALRIGTAPDKCDILYVHAHPDGTRKNLMGGNQRKSLFKILNVDNWAEGDYYISVQAIDPNNMGSEFSDYAIFEKKQLPCSFELQYTYPLSVGDTCKAYPCNAVYDKSYKWNWTVSGGRVVENSQEGKGYCKIVFDEVGDREISLVITDVNGRKSKNHTKSVNVQRRLFTEWEKEAELALDLDEDGRMEIFASSKFYTIADDGKPELITKLYNNSSNLSHISKSKSYTVDANNDGMVDVFSIYPWYFGQDYFTAINQGELNMTIGEATSSVLLDEYIPKLIDLDNDGQLDLVYQEDYGIWYFLKNIGGYSSFKNISLNFPQEYYSLSEDDFQDFTGDGLVDVRKKDSPESGYSLIYENQGDFTFLPVDTLEYARDNALLTEDFDNDGLADRLYETKSEYSIVWGDGTTTQLHGVTPQRGKIVFDYNNDGCEDMAAYGGSGDEEGVILLFHDHSFEFVNLGHLVGCIPTMFTVDDKIAISQYILTAENERPTAPTNLSAGRNAKGIILSWAHGTDKETPQSRLKYNLSVKRKGQTGEGAYIISPCNSTKNGVHVPTLKPLVEGNVFLLPNAVIPAGEYEVQVQTVDRLWSESDFSEVFNLTVEATAWIESPAATGVGKETQVVIASSMASAIDWDGGEVIKQAGNNYTVVWPSAGEKNIRVEGSKQTIYVHPQPDATFNVPSSILAEATVNITGKNLRNSQWSISPNGKDFVDAPQSALMQILVENDENAVITILQAGHYTIRHSVTGEYGTGICERQIEVVGTNAIPELQNVTTASGFYHLSWNVPSALPNEVTAINIYKETSQADVYRLLATVSCDNSEYTDTTSMPDVQSARYALNYVLSYGESAMGTPHQGMHVMINRGVGTSWNLAWTKYEGREVQTYRILRGTSAGNLELIGEVSGNMTSFSDLNPSEGTLYYAVEIVHAEAGGQVTRAAGGQIVSRSNVVSTEQAGTVVFVESIVLDGGEIIANEKDYLVLHAQVLPYYATYQGVNWVVEEGRELATIDSYGHLTATGKGDGKVVVRAYALDGSGIYAETVVTLDGFVAAGVDTPCQEENVSVRILQSGSVLQVSAPVGSQVAIYDLSGRQVSASIQENEVSYYRIVPKGLYILRVGEDSYKIINH